ncbi:MAG: APC family permease [Thermoanaerobaculia bacterium]
MSILDTVLGKPLTVWQGEEQKIGVASGVPILGLDGLSSAAYGPEAALTILIPLGALGVRAITPITALILVLLAILYFSYRQTIAAYPNGGGSYVVAKENLGTPAGLLAAAALLLDYVLNVAVGISAGIGALVSAVPSLHAHILGLCLVTLVLITIANLRGVRESGIAFALPTWMFVGTLGIVIVTGVARVALAGGPVVPAVTLPPVPEAVAGVSLWLLMRSFASGCTAMTGVEAVSNAVPIFRKPAVRNAQGTLTVIVLLLGGLLAGIAFLSRAYGISAMDQEQPGYQTILSLLVMAVFGRGAFYYVAIGSVLLVLALSANTSYAGFPRLCRMIAEDEYLPRSLANVGRRLVYSTGILTLALLAGILLVIFGGITDRLIPLFAVGAFGAFALSQAGMVVHWRRSGGHRVALAVNAIGAAATAVALAVILIAKFAEGAWVTVVLIPSALFVFLRVKRHYRFVASQTICEREIDLSGGTEPPIVVVPVRAWDTVTEKALRFALRISPDVIALHVAVDQDAARLLSERWERVVVKPVEASGRAAPELEVLPSPYRRLFAPIVGYVRGLAWENPRRRIAVVLPDLVERGWWKNILHNHRAEVLRELLLRQGEQRTVVVSVPWYIE